MNRNTLEQVWDKVEKKSWGFQLQGDRSLILRAQIQDLDCPLAETHENDIYIIIIKVENIENIMKRREQGPEPETGFRVLPMVVAKFGERPPHPTGTKITMFY